MARRNLVVGAEGQGGATIPSAWPGKRRNLYARQDHTHGQLEQRLAAVEEAVGSPGVVVATLLGDIVFGETAARTISAGLRFLTVSTPPAWGLVVGQDIILSPAAMPAGNYAVHGAIVTAPDTMRVTLTVPLLPVGSSYSITCRVRRLA
jgi:hypothetical protein